MNGLIESFNDLKENDEKIIGRLSTAATVLAVGVAILNNVRTRIVNEN